MSGSGRGVAVWPSRISAQAPPLGDALRHEDGDSPQIASLKIDLHRNPAPRMLLPCTFRLSRSSASIGGLSTGPSSLAAIS